MAERRRTRVPATVPDFSETDIAFITGRFADLLRGKSFLSLGKYGEAFEERFAAFIETRHAVACNSGTGALELIYRALGVEGKEIVLPSNTFAATAYAAMRAGATPVFADCGDDLCLDADAAARRITPRTAVLTHVHIGGLVSPSILKLRAVCRRKGIHLVEDACQAHGASLGGVKAGAFGTAAAFSFFSTKVMTTSEGGMVTTNRADLAKRMRSLREFGKAKTGVYVNVHRSVGYNWRMPEVAALMGLRQLAALPRFLRRRRELAALYTRELDGVPELRIVLPVETAASNYFKYIVILPHHDRVRVHQELVRAGVSPGGYVYELPLHQQPVFSAYRRLRFPRTEYLCRHHLCLPLFTKMSERDVRYVTSTLKDILRR